MTLASSSSDRHFALFEQSQPEPDGPNESNGCHDIPSTVKNSSICSRVDSRRISGHMPTISANATETRRKQSDAHNKIRFNSPNNKLKSPTKEFNTPTNQCNTPTKRCNTPTKKFNTPTKQCNTPTKKLNTAVKKLYSPIKKLNINPRLLNSATNKSNICHRNVNCISTSTKHSSNLATPTKRLQNLATPTKLNEFAAKLFGRLQTPTKSTISHFNLSPSKRLMSVSKKTKLHSKIDGDFYTTDTDTDTDIDAVNTTTGSPCGHSVRFTISPSGVDAPTCSPLVYTATSDVEMNASNTQQPPLSDMLNTPPRRHASSATGAGSKRQGLFDGGLRTPSPRKRKRVRSSSGEELHPKKHRKFRCSRLL